MEDQNNNFNKSERRLTNQTEQQQIQVAEARTPFFVTIIAWLMLLGGIGSLLFVVPFMLLNFLLGLLQLLIAVGFIVVSFGVRHMKKWALYLFTAIVVLSVVLNVYDFIVSSEKELSTFVNVGINLLVLIYFWAISKKFI